MHEHGKARDSLRQGYAWWTLMSKGLSDVEFCEAWVVYTATLDSSLSTLNYRGGTTTQFHCYPQLRGVETRAPRWISSYPAVDAFGAPCARSQPYKYLTRNGSQHLE